MKRALANNGNGNRMMVNSNGNNGGNRAKRARANGAGGNNGNANRARRIQVYRSAFQQYGTMGTDEYGNQTRMIYTMTLRELGRIYGEDYFPPSWAYLIASIGDGLQGRSPYDFQLWEITEGMNDEEISSLTIRGLVEQFAAYGADISILSEEDWKNLYALLTVSYQADH